MPCPASFFFPHSTYLQLTYYILIFLFIVSLPQLECNLHEGRDLPILFAAVSPALGTMPVHSRLSHKHLLIFLLHLWADFNAKDFYMYFSLLSFKNICNESKDRIVPHFPQTNVKTKAQSA